VRVEGPDALIGRLGYFALLVLGPSICRGKRIRSGTWAVRVGKILLRAEDDGGEKNWCPEVKPHAYSGNAATMNNGYIMSQMSRGSLLEPSFFAAE